MAVSGLLGSSESPTKEIPGYNFNCPEKIVRVQPGSCSWSDILSNMSLITKNSITPPRTC